MLGTLREDVRTIQERDPAARTGLEIVLCYPGLHALWLYRVAHRLWLADFKLLARLLSQFARWLTGVEIHPGARIGPRFFIDHGMGVVIGETAEVGADVTLYHGVTLGGVSLSHGKRHPTLEDGVVVGAGAKVLGAIIVGKDTRVGANAVVVKDVGPGMIVVGVPGKPVERQDRPEEDHRPNLRHDLLPDIVSERLDRVLDRLDAIECVVRSSNGTPRLAQQDPDYTI